MRDREMVAAIVAGDPAGLAAAYDSYAAALHAYCRSLLAEPADAADAVQDTFIIAAAKLGALRDPDRLRPWLYAVARNECHRRLRGRARFAPLDEAADVSDTQADASTGAGRAELKELLTAALAGLNPGDRDVIELNLRHEVEGPDLADALGVPLNQAHALASRARGQLERSLGALLVARTGREACPELDAMLTGWDGTLTILLRKRVSRHIENCEICGERKRHALSPAALFSVLPLFGLPPGLKHQILRLVSDSSPDAIRYRAHVVSRAGPFGPSGFPKQISPAVKGHKRGFRAHPAVYASAAAIILLAGGGSATYALKHKHTTADSRPAVRVTITVPPKTTAPAGPTTPTAPARPTTVPVVITSSPSQIVSPSVLQPPPSQVGAVTVSTPALTGSNGSVSCTSGPESITGSFTVTVSASSSAPVQLSWATSQNSSPSPGPTLESGSQVLSGQTSYAVTITGASFGSLPRPTLCGNTYLIAAVTAIGSDGQSVIGSGSYFVAGA